MSHNKEINEWVLDDIIHNYNFVKNQKVDLIEFDEFMSILKQNIQFFDENYLNHEIIESYYDFGHFDIRTEALILRTLWKVLSNNYNEIKYGDEKFKSVRIIERKQAQRNNELYPLGRDPYNPMYSQFPYDFYIGRYLPQLETTIEKINWLSERIVQFSLHAANEGAERRPYTLLKTQCEVKLEQLREERKMEILYDSNIHHNQEKPVARKQSKITAKFYALHCWCLIKDSQIPPFEFNGETDTFPMNELMSFCKRNYPKEISAQRFYQEFKKIDITNKGLILNNFGSDFRSKILAIDKNTKKMASFLRIYFK